VDVEGYRPLPIEDYALIGDCRSAALVGRNGSVDWLCWPHFDSDACFAALLGDGMNGRWGLAPADGSPCRTRSYRGDTLILETLFETPDGVVALVDYMPVGPHQHTLVRRVEGRRGRVPFELLLKLKFEYGSVRPWVSALEDGRLKAVAGQNVVVVRGPEEVQLRHEEGVVQATFDVAEGAVLTFVASWGRSHLEPPGPVDTDDAYRTTQAFWSEWAARSTYTGEFRGPVMRSLLTLKALSFTPTGALVAAPTTSLPEKIGGPRNWDYRYCWLRDATLTLIAMMVGGYLEEAQAWVDWLHRAVAGDPADLQIMYGLGGERRLIEWEVSWLGGYEGSAPVRVGNAASGQLQLDTYGEVMSALSLARHKGLILADTAWALQKALLAHLEQVWEEPDDGIWEVRGGRKPFTHSKVMAWLAFDRSIKDAERHGLDGPLEHWRQVRDRIHRTVCEKGFHPGRNSFTQSFDSDAIDASLLLIPRVGFLPPDDPRVLGTIKAVEESLLEDGFVLRYRTEEGGDGLPPGEGAFLPCSYWLAGAYMQLGRREEGCALFKRLLGLSNDVGLQSEEFDVGRRRLVGNFPQAYSHLSLVATAVLFDVSAGEARTITVEEMADAGAAGAQKPT
jgi:GH15 family glucan-1,4-alpha-glucosidase